MGCGNCGTGASGKPGGCKGNGGCSTGGCNRMNVFDWLSDLPLYDSAKPYPVMEVTFNKGSRKEFFRNNTHYLFEKGDWIAVEGVGGYDIGQVSLQGELVKLQMKKYGVTEQPNMKRVLRPATGDDLKSYEEHKSRETEIMVRSRAMARQMKLDMKIAEVELQADGRKGTFFYTADQRVDFRELIKLFAGEFRIKVEMRQIGARQESAKVGGIGSCGRELCCATWLTDFKSVNTSAARYQNLSINQTKLSGQCGRLKCCLNYELDTYMDALRVFPTDAETIETTQGRAILQKRDIFRNLMWYSYHGSNKQYPLTIERVREIADLNKQGTKPEELQAVELETPANKAGLKVDMGFVNDVGQISLKALEKGRKKKNKAAQKKGGSGKPGEAVPAGAASGAPAPGRQPNPSRPHGQKPSQPGGNKPQQGQRQQPRPPKGEGGKPQAGGQPQQRREGGPKKEGGQPRPEGGKPQQQQRPPKPRNPQQPRPKAEDGAAG